MQYMIITSQIIMTKLVNISVWLLSGRISFSVNTVNVQSKKPVHFAQVSYFVNCLAMHTFYLIDFFIHKSARRTHTVSII